MAPRGFNERVDSPGTKMDDRARRVQRLYLVLTLLTTLAASLIWGVNTLFLLDAGLSSTEAFVANAFYTFGMVLFEIPTGVIADTRGRRFSFLLGTATLLVATLLYVTLWWQQAPLGLWALSSVLIGLGFTFFSGATEAWLVDALRARGYEGALEPTFARAQVVAGAAMLTGASAGGFIAQATNLGVPYVVRAALLGVTLAVAWFAMRDEGFHRLREAPAVALRGVIEGAVDGGLRNRPVRWLMLAAPFTAGTGIYVFYASQPLLLALHGDPGAYGLAGLAAALIAGAQIVGGLLAPFAGRLLRRRTDVLVVGAVISVGALLALSATRQLATALVLLALWSLASAVALPQRQALVNGLIPSQQRATVLSFDSLMGSAGGVALQPALGRVADVAGYPASMAASALAQSLAVPFLLLARRERAAPDAYPPRGSGRSGASG